ncbi:hypothetical protein BJ508DRAFT_306385 [Ascobolus immersus RN42]|uniref:Uncharacterized protein n=1 Tax=Ascobolus immersus RN42 TaxID=1160509 RepID=A0A3N4IBM2_ASCIM|nr:hypothetical protein BJ508DRAFT_306385 [Ascobolus immersus RN42]
MQKHHYHLPAQSHVRVQWQSHFPSLQQKEGRHTTGLYNGHSSAGSSGLTFTPSHLTASWRQISPKMPPNPTNDDKANKKSFTRNETASPPRPIPKTVHPPPPAKLTASLPLVVARHSQIPPNSYARVASTPSMSQVEQPARAKPYYDIKGVSWTTYLEVWDTDAYGSVNYTLIRLKLAPCPIIGDCVEFSWKVVQLLLIRMPDRWVIVYLKIETESGFHGIIQLIDRLFPTRSIMIDSSPREPMFLERGGCGVGKDTRVAQVVATPQAYRDLTVGQWARSKESVALLRVPGGFSGKITAFWETGSVSATADSKDKEVRDFGRSSFGAAKALIYIKKKAMQWQTRRKFEELFPYLEKMVMNGFTVPIGEVVEMEG